MQWIELNISYTIYKHSCSNSVMPGRKKDSNLPRRCGGGAPRRWSCRPLIPLNTGKIHAKIMAQYRRRRKVLERLDEKLNVFYRTEQPEYDRFRIRTLGGVLTEERGMMEELSLLKSRIGKLQFVATFRMIEPWQVFRDLYVKSKTDDDVWDLLESEVETCENEKRERELREKMRGKRIFSHFFDDDSSPDDLVKEIFNRMFSFMSNEEDEYGRWTTRGRKKDCFRFDNDFYLSSWEKNTDREREEKLKRIYRELCIKYHPDKAGCFDDKLKHVWLEIQEAYRSGDLEKLVAIRLSGQGAGNLESLSCSEVLLILDDLEKTIADRRNDVKMVKKQDAWGFSKLSPQERDFLAEKELNIVNMRCLRIRCELREARNCLQNIFELSGTEKAEREE